MLITCSYCGKQFEAKKKHRKYCSDLCRVRAFRERKNNDPQKREEQRQQVIEAEKRAEAGRKEFLKRVADGDKTARLMYLKQQKPFSEDYWSAFEMYDREFGENFVSVINGIRTDHPEFVEAVMLSISEEHIIRTGIEKK